MLISIQKCKELNSELILVFSLGLGPHTGPYIYFFLGEMSDQDVSSTNSCQKSKKMKFFKIDQIWYSIVKNDFM